MGVGMCHYAQLVQTKNKHCKSAIILQCYHPHLSDLKNKKNIFSWPSPQTLTVTGLFVPLHFRSREQKDHREIERTFVPWNFRSSAANVPRTFVPWNFRTHGTFAPQTTFVPFNFRSCGTFAPVHTKKKGYMSGR